jgi:hypothetical protein
MKTLFERMSETQASVSDEARGLAWRVAMAIYREYKNRPIYAQGQMNGILAAELAVAAIRAMRDPDPRMVAAALPLIQHPTDEQRAIGKAALALLPPVRVEQHFLGEQAAADLVRDWQAMIDAAAGPQGNEEESSREARAAEKAAGNNHGN